MEIPKSERAPEINGLLEAVMGKLEKDRAALQVCEERQSGRLGGCWFG